MGDNILIVHGGGPTSVINASLYGAVKEAKKYKEIDHIYAARNGTGGLMREELIGSGRKVRTFTEYAGKCDRNIQRSD